MIGGGTPTCPRGFPSDEHRYFICFRFILANGPLKFAPDTHFLLLIEQVMIGGGAPTCFQCGAPVDSPLMNIVDIPTFKEVLVLTTDCKLCLYKGSELSSAGPIPARGRRITLKVRRDVADCFRLLRLFVLLSSLTP
jgi:hypothetical protein